MFINKRNSKVVLVSAVLFLLASAPLSARGSLARAVSHVERAIQHINAQRTNANQVINKQLSAGAKKQYYLMTRFITLVQEMAKREEGISESECLQAWSTWLKQDGSPEFSFYDALSRQERKLLKEQLTRFSRLVKSDIEVVKNDSFRSLFRLNDAAKITPDSSHWFVPILRKAIQLEVFAKGDRSMFADCSAEELSQLADIVITDKHCDQEQFNDVDIDLLFLYLIDPEGELL